MTANFLKNFVLILTLFSSYKVFAFIGGDGGGDGHEHTPIFCSSKNMQICAHLQFVSEINTKAEGVFVAHFLTPKGEKIQDLKIDLWMEEHGHGSAPLEIESMGENQFKAQNAWFVMSGPWLVRLFFKYKDESYQINIPISVLE